MNKSEKIALGFFLMAAVLVIFFGALAFTGHLKLAEYSLAIGGILSWFGIICYGVNATRKNQLG